MREASRALPVLAVLVGCVAGPLEAQLHYGSDVALHSRYEWRGIRRHDGAVLQTDLFVGFGRDLRLTGGFFSNTELSPASGSGIGFGKTWFGETNLWAEVGVPVGDALDLAAGVISYFYDTDAARGAPAGLDDTSEIHARATLLALPLVVPEIRAWWDVGRVEGLYLEGSLAVRIPLWNQVVVPLGSLLLIPRIGVNAGQQVDTAAGMAGYFAETGVTHWGFTSEVPIGPIPLGAFEGSLRMALHFEWKVDDLARIEEGGGTRRFAWWPSFWVTVLGPACRPTRELCPGPF